MISNGAHLKQARHALGLSIYQLADELRLDGTRESVGRRIRDFESGRKPLWGPVAVAVEGMLQRAGINTLSED